MTRLPDALAPKLAKLLPRLASDHDGEVIATARAIGRTLSGAGCDLHDLVGALDRPEPVPRVIYRDHPPTPEATACRSVREATNRVNWLLEEPQQLSPREDEFLRSLRGWLRAGRSPSEKQAAWLQAIYARCFLSGDCS